MLDATTVSSGPRRRDRALTSARSDVLVGALLVIVVLLGGYFRFVGQNWDDFTHLHPDERFLAGVAASLGGPLHSSYGSSEEQQAQLDRCLAAYPTAGGAGGFFDADCSTWNPHNTGNGLYVYGTLPLFMARAAGDTLVRFTGNPNWAGYNGVHLVWRTLSALAEMAAVLAVFALGVQVAGRWTGLLAATLYAGAALSIQLAHFGTADAVANGFTALALLFAVRAQFGGRWADYALFGLMFGAALASRINLAPLAGLIVLAAGVRALPALGHGLRWAERERTLLREAAGLALAGAVTLVVFRLTNPYAFMGPGLFGLTPNPRWPLAAAARAGAGPAGGCHRLDAAVGRYVHQHLPPAAYARAGQPLVLGKCFRRFLAARRRRGGHAAGQRAAVQRLRRRALRFAAGAGVAAVRRPVRQPCVYRAG